jgi:hypothetical protein
MTPPGVRVSDPMISCDREFSVMVEDPTTMTGIVFIGGADVVDAPLTTIALPDVAADIC